jgi:hypothetical protein
MTDADMWQKQCERARRSAKEWEQSCDYWRNRCTDLIHALEKAKYPHMVCDDCWYSCPKSSEGCCNDELSKDVCTCGADIHNKAIDAVLKGYVP